MTGYPVDRVYRPEPDLPLARLARSKQVVHVLDARTEPGYIRGYPPLLPLIDIGGARTLLQVPMLKEDVLVGAISIYRQEVRPFTDKQIALVANFAAQAVIAIENARLLSELRQRTDELGRSVGELRALGEVSQAVNSTLDLETVLCEEVEMHMAYRWFCRLDLDDTVPDHSTFSVNRHGRFRDSDLLRQVFEAVVASRSFRS